MCYHSLIITLAHLFVIFADFELSPLGDILVLVDM